MQHDRTMAAWGRLVGERKTWGCSNMEKVSKLLAGSIFALIGVGSAIIAIGLGIGNLAEPAPGFFPFAGGIVLAFLSLLFLVQEWRQRADGSNEFQGDLRRPVIAVIGLVVYTAFFETVCYIIATTILSAIVLRVLDTKSLRVIAVVSLLLSIGSYLLFDQVLGVKLPKGIWMSIS